MIIYPNRFLERDIEERVRWINNPLIHNSMFFDLPATIEQTERWYMNNVGNKNRIDFTFRDMNDEIIAMGGFIAISNVHKNGEFYIMVNPLMQGRGIGKKVSRWMYNYAFSVLKLNKIYLYTNDDNIKAYSIYEDAGFVLEGVLREHKIKNGVFVNRRFYGLLKSEWEKFDWKIELENEL